MNNLQNRLNLWELQAKIKTLTAVINSLAQKLSRNFTWLHFFSRAYRFYINPYPNSNRNQNPEAIQNPNQNPNPNSKQSKLSVRWVSPMTMDNK